MVLKNNEKIKNKKKTTELWKPFGLCACGQGKQIKGFLWERCIIQSEVLENADIFKTFCPEFIEDLKKKCHRYSTNFTNKATNNYDAKASCDVPSNFQLSNFSENILKRLEWRNFS